MRTKPSDGYTDQTVRGVQRTALTASAVVSTTAPTAARPGRLSRFVDANQRFCRRHLRPRLYPVSHMTALDNWFDRRTQSLPRGGTLLEFGCGHSFRLTELIGARFARRCATDIEDVAADRVPADIEFRRCTAEKIPFADGEFDAVVLRSVMEHVDTPATTFRELARVIRTGGVVLMNLPNKWDYVSVVAMMSGSLKSSLLKNVLHTQYEDFPVRYRCNTKSSLRRFATDAGFAVEQWLPLPSQPTYLSFFVPLYVLGSVYQFAISLLALDFLQPSFVVILRKRG